MLHPALLSRFKSGVVNDDHVASLEALQAREVKLHSREIAVAEHEAALELKIAETNKKLRELNGKCIIYS